MEPKQIKRLKQGVTTFEADLNAAGIKRGDLDGILSRAKAGEIPTKGEVVMLRAAMDVFSKILKRGRASGFVQ